MIDSIIFEYLKYGMEDHRLKAFCLVVEMKSFSKAAEAKFMTQSAMSHLIKNLEDELGVRLLNRKGKSVLPTPAGKIFYNHAKDILGQYRHMENDIYTLTKKIKGTLYLGSSATAATYLLPQVLYNFSKNYPEVQIELSVSNTEGVIGSLYDGKFDIGIVEGKIRNSNLFLEEIAEDEIVIIASDDNPLMHKHSLVVDDLLSQSFIMPETGSGIRELIEDFLRAADIDTGRLKIYMTLGNPELIVQMVQSGMGIAFVSKWSVFRAIKDGTIRIITMPGINLFRKFYLVSLERELKAITSRTFHDFIKGFRFFVPF